MLSPADGAVRNGSGPGHRPRAGAGAMGFQFLQVPQAAVMPCPRSSRVNAE